MAWSARIGATTEILEIVDGQAITGEVKLNVLRQRSVSAGEDEAIATVPVGVVRIVLDVMLIKCIGDWSQGNGEPGWPLPARSTASAESTFAILTARSSKSDQVKSVIGVYFPSNILDAANAAYSALQSTLTLLFHANFKSRRKVRF